MSDQNVDVSGMAWETPRTPPLRIVLDGQKMELTAANVFLGRAPTNEVVLDPAKFTMSSGRHARIGQRDGLWWIEDLKSTNGTYVNGQAIAYPQRLRDGDEVCFGPPGFEGVAVVSIVSGAGTALPSGLPAQPPSAPAAPARSAPSSAPSAGSSSGPVHAVAQPEDAGWNPFKKVAKVVGRFKERREIQKEIRDLEQRLPQLRSAAHAATTALAAAAWQQHAKALDGLPGTAELVTSSEQLDQLASSMHEADRRIERQQAAWTAWEASWKSRDAELRSDHEAAQTALKASQAEFDKARAAVREACKPWRELLDDVAPATASLHRDLGDQPSDDIAKQAEAVASLLGEAESGLRKPPAELKPALEARRKAEAGVTGHRAAVDDAAKAVETAKAERTAEEASHKARLADAQKDRAGIESQRKQLHDSLGPHFEALGRELLQSPRGEVQSLGEFAQAAEAQSQCSQAEANLEELKRQLADAS